MMRTLLKLVLSMLIATPALALDVKHPFSATAVKQLPGHPERQAMIYVTADKVRMEYQAEQGRRVDITDLRTGDAFTLLPEQRVYARHMAAPSILQQLQQAEQADNPCVVPSEAVCTKSGQEILFGRLADKWEMVVEHQGQQYRSLYWIDTERHMPLRQIWADGTVTELRPAGQEQRAGRDTEKWQLTMRAPDGSTYQGEQWFDIQLQIMTAEVISGGYRRELRDIRVAPQDAALFEVPHGYRQVTAQSLLQAGQPQGRP